VITTLDGPATEPEIVRLASARECMERMWECSIDDIGEIGGIELGSGEERTFSPHDVLRSVEARGIDGYTDGTRIFVWYDPERCPLELLVEFLAHELAHMEPDAVWQETETAEDEGRATVVGQIAARAYLMARHLAGTSE
jgi:hypothetical protein